MIKNIENLFTYHPPKGDQSERYELLRLNAKVLANKLKENGCEGIILGCTEIPLIIKQEDVDIVLFNTLNIQLEAASNFAIN